MAVAGLAYGAFAHERRCDPRPIEALRALRVGDRDKPADIEVVTFGRLRQRYFLCPAPGCGRMARALYDPDGTEHWCRRCARLDYDVRHRLRDPVVLAAALRRRLRAPPGLADPLPPRPADPRARAEYDALTFEIAVAEGQALKHLRRMAAGLEGYAKRRGIE